MEIGLTNENENNAVETISNVNFINVEIEVGTIK